MGKPKHIINGKEGIGINVDETIKGIFEKGYKKYYLTKQKKSLREVFTLILRDYFSDKVIVNGEE